MDTYTEISPSGRGLHLIFRARFEHNKKETHYDGDKHLAIYVNKYFTMTGDILDDGHTDVEERTEQLQQVHKKYIDVQKNNQNTIKKTNFIAKNTGFLTENDVFDRIDKSKNRDAIYNLLNGNWKGRYPSCSEADLAIMNHLAYYADRNESLIWSVFTKCGLYREDEYRRNPKKFKTTLGKAVQDCQECYSERRERASEQWKSRKKKHDEPPEVDQGLDVKDNRNMDEQFNVLFAGGSYKAHNTCLYFNKKKEDGSEDPIYLANFIIKPESEVIRDDGQDSKMSFLLSAYQLGKQLSAIADIEADKFSRLDFIIPTWGLNMRMSTATNTERRVRDAIQALSCNIPVRKVFTHTGWRTLENKLIYLHAGGAVGIDNATVELEGKLENYKLPERQSNEIYKDAAELALEFLKIGPPQIMYSLFACVSLSILCYFMKKAGCEPSFILFLLGKTGTFKSTLAALTLNFLVLNSISATFQEV